MENEEVLPVGRINSAEKDQPPVIEEKAVEQLVPGMYKAGSNSRIQAHIRANQDASIIFDERNTRFMLIGLITDVNLGYQEQLENIKAARMCLDNLESGFLYFISCAEEK